MKCDVCDGQGSLARGGFHKRNPVAIARIVGQWLLQSAFSFSDWLSTWPRENRMLKT